MKLLSAFVIWMLSIVQGYSQCPGGICPVPTPSRPHGWYAGDGQTLNLYWKGELIGSLEPATAVWRTEGKPYSVNLLETFDIKKSRRPDCPCPDGNCPCVDCQCVGESAIAFAADAPAKNFGVDWSQMRKDGRETFRIGGAEVPQHQVYTALASGSPGVPDDARTPRLVVLGSTAGRRKVLDDMASPALAAFNDKVIVQAYPPDHWHVAEVGYKQVGDPTIYLVDARGKVVTWQKDYEGGPQRLAKTLTEGLRVADPNFDPSKSPDLSKPAEPAPKPSNSSWPQWLFGLAVAASAYFITRKKG